MESTAWRTYRLLRLHERQVLQGQRPEGRAARGVGAGVQPVDHLGGHVLEGAVRRHLREADGVDGGPVCCKPSQKKWVVCE